MLDPFKPFKDNVDLEKYQKIINEGLKKTIEFLERCIKNYDFTESKKTFFEILEGKEYYNKNNPNHKIAYLASRFISFDILLSVGKIDPYIKKLHYEWFNYLFNRIYRDINYFSNKILEELYSDYPVGDSEIFQTVSQRVLFNIYKLKKKGYVDLIDLLKDPKIHPWEKILEFENIYRFDYAVFLIRSGYLGEELAKFEGNKDYSKDLDKIFQLKNNNERTPPQIVVKEIERLKHVRNAISHPERAGIRYKRDINKVKIMAYDPKKKIYSYQEEIRMIDLWDISYILTLLDRDFVSAALAISIIKDLS